MSIKLQQRLWRVDWYHINGYQASYQLYEAKIKKEVHNIAKEGRLADFPDSWHFTITPLDDLIKINGKWLKREY